jgi:hypothetical protein
MDVLNYLTSDEGYSNLRLGLELIGIIIAILGGGKHFVATKLIDAMIYGIDSMNHKETKDAITALSKNNGTNARLVKELKKRGLYQQSVKRS